MPLDNGSFVCFFISARQLVVQISALLVFLTTASVLSKPASSSCFSYPLPLPFNLFHLKPFFPIGEHNGHESSISELNAAREEEVPRLPRAPCKSRLLALIWSAVCPSNLYDKSPVYEFATSIDRLFLIHCSRNVKKMTLGSSKIFPSKSAHITV